jgi:DNA-binding IclR family transcriptional regulator
MTDADKRQRKSASSRSKAVTKKKSRRTGERRPAPLTDERATKKAARLALQRASRRPRAAAQNEGLEDAGGRLFVSALARGLEVLGAFRAGDGPLGNSELAERTQLPKPTISRITHTLTQLGYFSYDQRAGTYQLGGRTLLLAYAALAGFDVRRIARPIMEELADAKNLHIALATRDKLMMLNLETCEGHGLVGVRLAPGSRVPIAVTAIGKAYLAATSERERRDVLDTIRRQHGEEWPMIVRSIETSIRDIDERGFCASVGEWRKDINSVGAPIVTPNNVYAISVAGPAYLVSQEQLDRDFGPAVAKAARTIATALGG